MRNETLPYPADTSRAIAKLHYSNTFARTPDVKYQFVHAGGTIPFLAERFAIIDEMNVTPELRSRFAHARPVWIVIACAFEVLSVLAYVPGFPGRVLHADELGHELQDRRR